MKINYYGKKVNSIKDTIRKIFNIVLTLVIISTALLASFFIGAYTFSTNTVEARNILVVTQVKYPVLDRIADCESGNGKKGTATQFRNGQVILHANRNRTTDIGKYQINMEVWGKKAGELGYNLSTEQGNTKMAEWIYLNKGTGSWYSSSRCWHR